MGGRNLLSHPRSPLPVPSLPFLLPVGPLTIKESRYRLGGWSYQCAYRKLSLGGGSGSGFDRLQAAPLKNNERRPEIMKERMER
ncbi:MAG: hypothetical protein ACREA2_24720, partial [Blastocatellia bacterium]